MDKIQTDHEEFAKLIELIGNREGIIPPDFQPDSIDNQSRLDQKAKVTCPECGHEFTP